MPDEATEQAFHSHNVRFECVATAGIEYPEVLNQDKLGVELSSGGEGHSEESRSLPVGASRGTFNDVRCHGNCRAAHLSRQTVAFCGREIGCYSVHLKCEALRYLPDFEIPKVLQAATPFGGFAKLSDSY